MNVKDSSNLKISTPKNFNDICLDIVTSTSPSSNSPSSNTSLSPIMRIENNFINIPSKIELNKIEELTEFDICGEYFQNVIVDEYEKKIRKISKSYK